MTRKEAEMKIKAAAYAVATEIGWREALQLLEKVKAEIENIQWQR